MGIDKVNPKHNANVFLPKKQETAPKEGIQDAVISAPQRPASDTVRVTNPIPEWANIEKSDGKIGDFKQGDTGDCWLLATLIAIKKAGAEAKFITPRIKKDRGKIVVSVGAGKDKKQFSFTQSDVRDRILKPSEEIKRYRVSRGGEQIRDIIKKYNCDRLTPKAIRRFLTLNRLNRSEIPVVQGGKVVQVPHIFGKLSEGDIDVMALEMAHEKSIGKELKGDYASTAVKSIIGRPLTSIYFDTGKATTGNENAPADEAKANWSLFEYAQRRKGNIAIIASTGDRATDRALVKRHAYAVDVKKTNKNFVYLINPHDSSKTIKMPMSHFKSNFLRVSIADLSDYQTYKVQSGDNISKIAKKYGVNAQDLMLANPTLKDVDKISIGMSLNIPVIK